MIKPAGDGAATAERLPVGAAAAIANRTAPERDVPAATHVVAPAQDPLITRDPVSGAVIVGGQPINQRARTRQTPATGLSDKELATAPAQAAAPFVDTTPDHEVPLHTIQAVMTPDSFRIPVHRIRLAGGWGYWLDLGGSMVSFLVPLGAENEPPRQQAVSDATQADQNAAADDFLKNRAPVPPAKAVKPPAA